MSYGVKNIYRTNICDNSIYQKGVMDVLIKVG